MAEVLIVVQTKQIKINIHKRNNTKNTVQIIQNRKHKYTYYQNTHSTPPHPPTHTRITKQVKTTAVQDIHQMK